MFIDIDNMATSGNPKGQARARKPNFKQEELSVLVEEVAQNKTVLLGKFTDTVNNERKKKIWNSIATKCRAIGDSKRSGEEMKKKWQDWSSQVKGKNCKEIRERRQTGGGTAEDSSSFTATEIRVLAILGQTPLVGVPGGTDAFDKNNNKSDDLNNRSDDLNNRRDDLNIRLVDSDPLYCAEDPSTLSDDGEEQVQHVSDTEDILDANQNEQQPQSTQRDAENTDKNQVNPLLIRSDQERMIDEQLRRSIRQQEEKQKSQKLSDSVHDVAKPKRMKLTCSDTLDEPSSESKEIIEIEKQRLKLENDRLNIERDRLVIERERLHVEKKNLMWL